MAEDSTKALPAKKTATAAIGTAPIADTPSAFSNFLVEVGEVTRFSTRYVKEVFLPPYEMAEFWRQCYEIGYRSIFIVGITGFIMGMVLTLQSQPTLAKFGAESFLPSMVSISIFREIGPIITALICAGRVGSSIGAELGSMKVTEQIDAMEVSGTSPFHYLVVSRVLAATLMVPLLCLITDGVAMVGSWLACNITATVSVRLFIHNAFDSLAFSDIIPAISKCFFFGFTIGIIGCYNGYNSENGTQGVGTAANSTVVTSIILIFIIDLVAVQLTSLILSIGNSYV